MRYCVLRVYVRPDAVCSLPGTTRPYRNPPFHQFSDRQLFLRQVQRHNAVYVSDELREDLRTLIESCVTPAASQRPSMAAVHEALVRAKKV